MPELLDTQTGQPVSVSDVELPHVLASSERLAMPQQQVVLIAPDGHRFETSSTDPGLGQALSTGWKLEDPTETRQRAVQAQYGGTGGELKAAAAGALRGPSFGLSDQLLVRSGIVDPETLAGLKEANPASTNIGEIGGIAASLLVPGGAEGAAVHGAEEAGAIAQAAKTAGKIITAPIKVTEAISGVAGKTAASLADALLPATAGSPALAKTFAKGAQLATQGIVDGALFSAGQLVSEQALGDTQLNTERIISHIGMSALLGGALGGTLGTVMGAWSPVATSAKEFIVDNIDKIPGISKEGIAEILKTQSYKAALSSISALGGLIKKLEKQHLSELGPEAMFNLTAADGKPIMREGLNAEQILERMHEATDSLRIRISGPIDAVDAVGLNADFTPKDIAARLRKKVLKPLSGEIGVSEAKNYTQRVIDDLLEMGTPSKTEELTYKPVTHRWLQDMRARMGSGWEQDRVADEARRSIERELNTILEDSLSNKLPREQFLDYLDAKKSFHSIAAIQKATGNRVATLEGNRYFSLSDRMTSGVSQAITGGLLGGMGGAAGGAAAGALGVGGSLAGAGAMGLTAAVAARLARTRGASVWAVMLNKASKMMALEHTIKSATALEDLAISDAVGELFKGKQKKYSMYLDPAIEASSGKTPTSVQLASGATITSNDQGLRYETFLNRSAKKALENHSLLNLLNEVLKTRKESGMEGRALDEFITRQSISARPKYAASLDEAVQNIVNKRKDAGISIDELITKRIMQGESDRAVHERALKEILTKEVKKPAKIREHLKKSKSKKLEYQQFFED